MRTRLTGCGTSGLDDPLVVDSVLRQHLPASPASAGVVLSGICCHHARCIHPGHCAVLAWGWLLGPGRGLGGTVARRRLCPGRLRVDGRSSSWVRGGRGTLRRARCFLRRPSQRLEIDDVSHVELPLASPLPTAQPTQTRTHTHTADKNTHTPAFWFSSWELGAPRAAGPGPVPAPVPGLGAECGRYERCGLGLGAAGLVQQQRPLLPAQFAGTAAVVSFLLQSCSMLSWGPQTAMTSASGEWHATARPVLQRCRWVQCLAVRIEEVEEDSGAECHELRGPRPPRLGCVTSLSSGPSSRHD